jgi:hypothetical protein
VGKCAFRAAPTITSTATEMGTPSDARRLALPTYLA